MSGRELAERDKTSLFNHYLKPFSHTKERIKPGLCPKLPFLRCSTQQESLCVRYVHTGKPLFGLSQGVEPG